MQLKVYTTTGADSAVRLDVKPVLAQAPLHHQAVHDVLVAQHASQRQGTHQTKGRAEVAGGGRKPWKQKGTGRARQGSIRSPQWRGGGVVFGPTTAKSYSKKVNKKVHRLAMRSLIGAKLQANAVLVIDDLAYTKYHTKTLLSLLKELGLHEERHLILAADPTPALVKSAANLKYSQVLAVNAVSPRALALAEKLIVTKAAWAKLEEVYG